MPTLSKRIRPVAATTGQSPNRLSPITRGYLFLTQTIATVNPSRGQTTHGQGGGPLMKPSPKKSHHQEVSPTTAPQGGVSHE